MNCRMKTYGHEVKGTLGGFFYLFMDRTPNLNDFIDPDEMPNLISVSTVCYAKVNQLKV